jgi:hypothetical protein
MHYAAVAAPQRQQLVNCGSSCSPQSSQIQALPLGAVAARASALRAYSLVGILDKSCGQVSIMGRSPSAPARY